MDITLYKSSRFFNLLYIGPQLFSTLLAVWYSLQFLSRPCQTLSDLYSSKSFASTHELSEIYFEALPNSCGIVVVTFVSPMDVNPERLPRKQVNLHNFDPFFWPFKCKLSFCRKV